MLAPHLYFHIDHNGSASSTTPLEHIDVFRPHFEPAWLHTDHSLSDALLELLHLLQWRAVLSPFPVMGPLTLNLSSTCTPPLHFFQTLPVPQPSLTPFFDSLFWSTGDRASSGSRFKSFTGKSLTYSDPPQGNVPWSACLLPYISECALISKVPSSSSSASSNSSSEITWDDIDAVNIHMRLSLFLPSLPLKPWQMVVGSSRESPINDRAPLKPDVMRKYTHLFNMHRDSDLLFIYLYTANKILSPSLPPVVPFKERADGVLWVASNCKAWWRTETVKRLMSHLRINSFGKCLFNMHRPVRDDDWRRAKFYLAWENSVCTDYISEKLWRTLADGVVPLYFGAPNVLEVVPTTHSVVSLHAFEEVAQITRFIEYVSEHEDAFQYLIAHRTGQSRIRQGFYYYLYMAQSSCDSDSRLCNLVATELPKIRHAKQHDIPIPHTLQPDLSCKTQSPLY